MLRRGNGRIQRPRPLIAPWSIVHSDTCEAAVKLSERVAPGAAGRPVSEPALAAYLGPVCQLGGWDFFPTARKSTNHQATRHYK